ncbi:LexA repressor [Dirofilaria immitis]
MRYFYCSTCLIVMRETIAFNILRIVDAVLPTFGMNRQKKFIDTNIENNLSLKQIFDFEMFQFNSDISD